MKKFKRVYIEITNICNLSCEFCPKSRRIQQEMKVQEFEEVLKKINDYTDYVYLHVKGEPLMHSNLKEILNLVEKYNKKCIITTNGILLKDKLDILKKSKCIRQINISVHSLSQNKRLNIDENKYMEELIDSVNEIVKSNNTYISYRFWNLEDISNLEKNSKLLNILGEKYESYNILDKIKGKSSLKLNEKIYINLDTIYVWPSLKNEVVSKTGNCYGLKEQIAILADGTVVPCCLDQDGDIILGNIFKNSLEQILNSDLTKEILNGFNNNILVNELCQKCGFRENKRR